MISIVIPLYNKAQSIEKTIRCIQAQTYQDFEVVVVEGWSTDGSTEIIQRLSEEDNRIRVLMQQNRHGVTPARNESVEAAQFEHIAFLDADDYWEPTYLEQMAQLIADYPEAGIWGLSYGELTAKGKILPTIPRVSDGFRGIVENPWKTGCPFWTGATAISKKAFERVGGFDNRIIYGEDIDLWYRIIANYPVAFYDRYMAFYLYDAENRAMNRKQEMRYYLPYYCDKYANYKGIEPFYTFIQRWCAVKIKECYFKQKSQRMDAKEAAKRLDYSVLPIKYKYLFHTPYPIGKIIYWLG